MSLSSQLVSSSNESAASKAALDERLAAAQRDNGKFVTELSSLRGELSEMRSAALTASTTHAAKDKQIGALTADVLSLTQQCDGLRKQLDGIDDVHSESAREQAEAFSLRIKEVCTHARTHARTPSDGIHSWPAEKISQRFSSG